MGITVGAGMTFMDGSTTVIWGAGMTVPITWGAAVMNSERVITPSPFLSSMLNAVVVWGTATPK